MNEVLYDEVLVSQRPSVNLSKDHRRSDRKMLYCVLFLQLYYNCIHSSSSLSSVDQICVTFLDTNIRLEDRESVSRPSLQHGIEHVK